MQFLNHPIIKNTAKTIATATDFPEWIFTDIGPFMYNTLGGKVFYDAFESGLSFTIRPQNLAALRKWYVGVIDPVHHTWALGKDPVDVLFWMFFYVSMLVILYFVSKAVAYPGRLEVKNFSLVHNIFLFLLSVYMGVSITANFLAEPDVSRPLDQPTTTSRMFAKSLWVFTLSKIPEFVDTFIMMLKQNYHQVSFLHVYHHLSILIFCIFFTGTAPGGCASYSAAMNSFVHTFMYFYYAATSFAGKTGHLRDFLNSIKFIITKGQMTQFAINFLHACYLVYLGKDSRFSPAHGPWMMAYMTTMLGLFGNFLIQGQRAAAKAAKAKKLAAEQKKKE